MGLVIKEMFAFVMIDEHGDETIPAFQAPDGMFMPLTGADMERIKSLMPVAKGIAFKAGKALKIYRYTEREYIDTVEPYGRV